MQIKVYNNSVFLLRLELACGALSVLPTVSNSNGIKFGMDNMNAWLAQYQI